MNTVDTIELLNKLIVTSKNSERGLRAAAEEAHHHELKQALFDYAHFFGESASELQHAVRQLGGHPKEIGTFAHTVHRALMHLKVTALGRDEDLILDETEGDETEIEERLATAVAEDMPPEVHALLERQYREAQRHHGQIREWRQSAQLH